MGYRETPTLGLTALQIPAPDHEIIPSEVLKAIGHRHETVGLDIWLQIDQAHFPSSMYQVADKKVQAAHVVILSLIDRCYTVQTSAQTFGLPS